MDILQTMLRHISARHVQRKAAGKFSISPWYTTSKLMTERHFYANLALHKEQNASNNCSRICAKANGGAHAGVLFTDQSVRWVQWCTMKDDGQAVTDTFQATIANFLIASDLGHNGGLTLGAANTTDCSRVKSLKSISTYSYMSHPLSVWQY